MNMHVSQQTIHDAGPKHIVPYVQYLLIWFGLLGLTALTVALAGIKLGDWIIITSLVIASTKALLVLNVFMHLKFEDRVFRWFSLVAFVVLLIFIGLTFVDYAFH
jgi:cytochrome c oxidase subunit IV